MDKPLEIAVRRVLAPLIRLLIARGVRLPQLRDLLKDLYLEQAEKHFAIDGKKMTDSRLSVLTGLQRKEIQARRIVESSDAETDARSMGPLPRVLSRWATGRRWTDEKGAPRVLPRKANRGPSFEALVAEVSRDVHPRTVLDRLEEAGNIAIDRETDRVTLLSASYLAVEDADQMAYLGANLGDHAEAAVENVSSGDGRAPFFERAVHYSQLTPSSVETLDREARKLGEQALEKLNRSAAKLQQKDSKDVAATGRFRCGVFVFHRSPSAGVPE